MADGQGPVQHLGPPAGGEIQVLHLIQIEQRAGGGQGAGVVNVAHRGLPGGVPGLDRVLHGVGDAAVPALNGRQNHVVGVLDVDGPLEQGVVDVLAVLLVDRDVDGGPGAGIDPPVEVHLRASEIPLRQIGGHPSGGFLRLGLG